jgi:HAD superfamily hydrolase (TIGR01509 family)
MAKAIIFDFFDVLRTDAYKAWLQRYDIPHEGAYFEASQAQDKGEITVEEFLERLNDLQGRTVSFEEIDGSATVNEAVVHIAERLKSNYRLALLSNAPSLFIRRLLRDLDLERLFDEIVISSEVGLVKPSPEIFELTLRKLGISAPDAIFIDDNKKHTEAAEEMGIRSVVFVSAGQLEDELNNLGIALA